MNRLNKILSMSVLSCVLILLVSVFSLVQNSNEAVAQTNINVVAAQPDNTEILYYSHSTNDGHWLIDENGLDVYVDYITLPYSQYDKDTKFSATFYNEWELESIQLIQ